MAGGYISQVGYHMSIETPEDASPEERKQIRAKGIEQALTDVATDPEFRLRMLMGEAYADYQRVLGTLQDKLGKESDAVRMLALKWAGRPDLLSKPIKDATVAHAQHIILIDATNGGTEVPRGTADVLQIENVGDGRTDDHNSSG